MAWHLEEPLAFVVVVFLAFAVVHPSLELMAFLVHPCCYGAFFVVHLDHHCFGIFCFVVVLSFHLFDLVVHRFVA